MNQVGTQITKWNVLETNFEDRIDMLDKRID